MTVFPERHKAPSPFRQNILQQFHGGVGAVGADVACRARHSCLPPTSSAATARELRQPASQRLLLQEATTQSQLSGPAADTSLSVRYFTPGTSPGSSREARGTQGQQWQFILSKAARDRGEPICLCLWLSIFHRSRRGSSRDLPHRNHWIPCNCLLLIITSHLAIPLPLLSWAHLSSLMWNNQTLACN